MEIDYQENLTQKKAEAYAYVSGCFNDEEKKYGYAGVIYQNGDKYKIQGNGNDINLAKRQAVAGQILASQETVKKAIELGIKNINIYYDLDGIKKWATGEWKRNNDETMNYYNFFQKIKSKINIEFIKIKNKSSTERNEVTKLSKEAAGICVIEDIKYKNKYKYNHYKKPDKQQKNKKKNKKIKI